MAKVLGEAGRYVGQAAVKKERRMVLWAIFCSGALFWIAGFLLGFLFHKTSVWVSLLINAIAVAAVLLILPWLYRQLDKLDEQRRDLRKGEAGEAAVGHKLQVFPDEFFVIHDLTTECGNIDHVVIGPTGVFAIDAKNWKGVVSANGKGELLCNTKPTDKPIVKQFVGRIMGIKDRVRALAPGIDPYVQALFVFTSARVEAMWGTTGPVHCIRDEQLYEYIVESKKGKKLNSKDVKTIAQAFLALARMDGEFADKTASRTRQPTHEIAARGLRALSRQPSGRAQT